LLKQARISRALRVVSALILRRPLSPGYFKSVLCLTALRHGRADRRCGFRSGGRWLSGDRPIHRAIRSACRATGIRRKRGSGVGVLLRAVWEIGESSILVPSTTEHESDQGVPSREGEAPQALGWAGRCGRPTPAACATTVAPAATPLMEGISKEVFHAA
jgi:hypothetical protein